MSLETTATWLPIRFRDFWDVPRIFLVEYGGATFLFDCPFDEGLEDYPDSYEIYLMPKVSEKQLSGSWVDLPQLAHRHAGRIRIDQVEFDPTRRHAIEAAILNEIDPSPRS